MKASLIIPLVMLLAGCSSGKATSPAPSKSEGKSVTSAQRQAVQNERMRQAMRMGRSGTIINPAKVWKDHRGSDLAMRNRALYEARKAAKERGIVHDDKAHKKGKQGGSSK